MYTEEKTGSPFNKEYVLWSLKACAKKMGSFAIWTV